MLHLGLRYVNRTPYTASNLSWGERVLVLYASNNRTFAHGSL